MKFAIFDTETTGLPKHPRAKMAIQPRVIEFGGLIWDSEKEEVSATLELLLDPLEPLEEIITKITGLTDEDLRGQPTFAAQQDVIADFFRGADCVIAHNLPFDTTLIELEFSRLNRDTDFWPEIRVCTVQESAERYGYRPKLVQLYEEFVGEPLAQTHRALDDVEALLKVCQLTGILDDVVAATENQN